MKSSFLETCMPITHSLQKLMAHETERSAAVSTQEASRSNSELQSFQNKVADWQAKTFPNQTIEGKLAHLAREVQELRTAPHDRTEWADVLILFLGSAHLAGLNVADLIGNAEAKFEIAKQRT